MTVVAAFTTSDRPTLVGDVMLTDLDTLKPAGAIRKLVSINKNLVVGWSGALWQAQSVCQELCNSLVDEATPALLLEKLREHYEYLKKAKETPDLGLVGWLYHGGQWTAFKWEVAAPDVLPLGNYFVLGTGAEPFMQQVPPGGLNPNAKPKRPVDTQFDPTINAVCRLTLDEMTTQNNQKTFYCGIAYDIWIAPGRYFQHIGSVTYSATAIRVDEEGRIAGDPENVGMFNCFERGEFLIYQWYEVATRTTRTGMVYPLLEVSPEVKGEAHRALKGAIKGRGGFTYHADKLSVYTQFYVTPQRPYPFVVTSYDRSKWSGDTRSITYPGRELLQWSLDQIVKDLHARGAMP
jgi:hypothetical protein